MARPLGSLRDWLEQNNATVMAVLTLSAHIPQGGFGWRRVVAARRFLYW